MDCFTRSLAGTVALVALLAQAAFGDVIVLANKTSAAVSVRLRAIGAAPVTARLEPGEARPFYSDGSINVEYASAAGVVSVAAPPNTVSYLTASRTGVALRRVDLAMVIRPRAASCRAKRSRVT